MKFIQRIIEIIFPTKCGICGKIMHESLCTKCKTLIKQQEIMKKQIKIRQEEDYTLLSCFLYDGLIRKKILELKFHDRVYLAKMFAKILVENEKTCRFLKSYDIIIPVPAHPRKKLERGYNQTEQIVKEIR